MVLKNGREIGKGGKSNDGNVFLAEEGCMAVQGGRGKGLGIGNLHLRQIQNCVVGKEALSQQTVLDPGKSKIKVLADLVFSEGPLSILFLSFFSLYPHMAERESSSVFLFLA